MINSSCIWPVIQSTDVSFVSDWTGCWTNSWMADDLRWDDAPVASLQWYAIYPLLRLVMDGHQPCFTLLCFGYTISSLWICVTYLPIFFRVSNRQWMLVSVLINVGKISWYLTTTKHNKMWSVYRTYFWEFMIVTSFVFCHGFTEYVLISIVSWHIRCNFQ